MNRTTRCTALLLARTAAGLRLLDVERETGVNQSLMSRMERGDSGVPRALIPKLAALYGVEPAVIEGKVPFSALTLPPVIVP